MYTLDTNTVIYYMDGDASVVEMVDSMFSTMSPIYISTMTALELLSLSTLQHDDFLRIRRIMNTMVVIPVDLRIAQIAGSIRRQIKIYAADAAIAATALMTKTTLVTRNTRDFERVPNLAVKPI